MLRFLAGVFTHLLDFSPIFLVAFLVFSSWAVLYKLCWLQLLVPADLLGMGFDTADYRGIGIALLVMFAIIRITWVGAWVQILVITWFCDRKWKPSRTCKNIMQVDSMAWQDAEWSPFKGSWIPYEEAVYLRTIKAYLYLLILLPLDVVLSFVVSAVALARYQTLVIHLTITVILSGFMIVPMVVFWTHDKFWLLACKNCTFPEKDISRTVPRLWTLVFKYADSRGNTRLHLASFQGKNPWDLGIEENLRQVFGRQLWQWFLFWWQPERVSRYGQYGDRDLPYADFVVRHRTQLLMTPLTHVAIDDGFRVASPTHGQASTTRRRQQRSSAASHSSLQHSSDQRRSDRSSTSHAEEPAIPDVPTAPAPAQPSRRRYEFSWTSAQLGKDSPDQTRPDQTKLYQDTSFLESLVQRL
ncbi:hypothetical protein UCREL1_6102 [Eutypa lata UCREL1]|uniref:Uncharacterized protein n=1 Tax=Eutypa lata (strain UCR-EL1) TaxID=1287681 RepID=M7TAJ7_EUTLA|nr:hypothetical protein UCREL1_6102 [Eutypa lata UCREL1]